MTDYCVTVNLYAFAGVESDGVDWETSLTFRDGAKWNLKTFARTAEADTISQVIVRLKNGKKSLIFI